MSGPTISVILLRHVANCVDLTGRSSDALLEEIGLTRASLDDRELVIPLQDFLHFFERAADYSRNPHFGLQAGRLVGSDSLGPLSFLFLSAPTLGQAFSSFVRYLETMQQASRNEFWVEGDRAVFEYGLADQSIGERRQDAEYSLGATYTLANNYCGNRLELIEVCFEHDRVGDYARYRDYFGCDVFFGQGRNSLAFDAAVLDRPGQLLSPELFPILVDHLRRKAHDGGEERLIDRVRGYLEAVPLERVPTLRAAGTALDIPAQTLHRRLKREGLSWRSIVTDRRMHAAARMLVEGERTVAEIALAVGYAESASFIRGFTRHFGATPMRYRKRSRLSGEVLPPAARF